MTEEDGQRDEHWPHGLDDVVDDVKRSLLPVAVVLAVLIVVNLLTNRLAPESLPRLGVDRRCRAAGHRHDVTASHGETSVLDHSPNVQCSPPGQSSASSSRCI